MNRIIGVLVVAVCLLTSVGVVPVSAAPPRHEDEAVTLVEYRRLSYEAEAAHEAAGNARQRLTDLRVRQREAAARARAASREAERTAATAGRARRAASAAAAAERERQGIVDDFARAALEGGVRFDGLAALLNSDSPGELMSARSLLDLLAADHAGVLSALVHTSRRARLAAEEADTRGARAEEARRRADREHRRVRALAGEAATTLAAARQRERVLSRKITDVRQALTELPAMERARLARTGPTVSGPLPGGSAGRVVGFALDQVGKPYSWGATGPGAYDCSGLVLAAYATAGIGLPRTSSAQSASGRPVSRAEVRTGDLVFYYQPVSHVAIAVDGEHAVHASTAGEPVKVAPIDAIGPVTAIRRIYS